MEINQKLLFYVEDRISDMVIVMLLFYSFMGLGDSRLFIL